jgi:hypothetical protein
MPSARLSVKAWAALVFGLAIVAGCASTPQATRERDAEAKEFATHPATAAIYIYRSPFDQPEGGSVLYLDQRLIGSTLRGGFFLVHAQPGERWLHGFGHDQGQLAMEVRPGETYFVALNLVGSTSHFVLKPAAVGRSELLACCLLLENWAPGQRPLLR